MEQARGIIVKTLTILAGFWIADLAAARVQAGLAAGESIERIMDGMTTMLQHPLAWDSTGPASYADWAARAPSACSTSTGGA